MQPAVEAPDLRAALLAWWQTHGRHWIPWKLRPDCSPPQAGEPLDPWPIWSAEIMLQQTQLQVVLPYWQRWMQTFPTAAALAAASCTISPGRARLRVGWRSPGWAAAPPAAS